MSLPSPKIIQCADGDLRTLVDVTVQTPEHGVRKEQCARKVWCATHAKPCLLTTQASWERLPPSWCHCFRRCLWSRPSSSLYSWTMTKDMDLLSLNSSYWDPELEKNVRGSHGHVCVINMWATHKHGSEQGRPVFFPLENYLLCGCCPVSSFTWNTLENHISLYLSMCMCLCVCINISM